MGENHGGGRGYEIDGHLWKAKAMEYKGRYEQEQRSRRAIETDYEILNKDLIESRKEIVKLRGTVERLNALTVQNSLELANYRSGVADLQATIRNLRETNERLLREGFQRAAGAVMGPLQNHAGLVSPARSVTESISNSTISSCNCPNCSPYLYTPSSVNSNSESGFRSLVNDDRIVCPVCCYHIKNPN